MKEKIAAILLILIVTCVSMGCISQKSIDEVLSERTPIPTPDIWTVKIVFDDGGKLEQSFSEEWKALQYIVETIKQKPDYDSFISRSGSWYIYHNGVISESDTWKGSSYKPTPTPTPVPPIPSNYYGEKCNMPVDVSLIEWLTTYLWAEEYQANSWDCSQMAAAVERELENCGYESSIQVGDEHAWVIIWLPEGVKIEETSTGYYPTPKDGWYRYESTGRYFPVGEDLTKHVRDYTAEQQYDDIYEVWDYYSEFTNGWEAFLKEYGWWRS